MHLDARLPMQSWNPVDVVTLRVGAHQHRTSPRSITPHELERRYLANGVPVIVENLFADWPAFKQWSSAFFRHGAVGQTRVHYERFDRSSGRLAPNSEAETTMADLVARIEAGEPLLMFGKSHPWTDVVLTQPELLQAIRPETVAAKVLPSARRFLGLDPFDYRLWPFAPPYAPHFYMGGENVTSPGHYDPSRDHTLHWCVWGLRSVKLLEFSHKVERSLWERAWVDFRRKSHPPFGLRGWATSIHPGQVLIMPPRMWHWFAYEKPSLSFVLRGRSFSSTTDYCAASLPYKQGAREHESGQLVRQGPETMLPVHSSFWNASVAARPQWPPLPDGPPSFAPPCSATDLRIGRALGSHLGETLACTRAVLRHACGSNWQVGGPLTDAADASFALPHRNLTELQQRCTPFLPAAYWRLLLCSLRFGQRSAPSRLQSAMCEQ